MFGDGSQRGVVRTGTDRLVTRCFSAGNFPSHATLVRMRAVPLLLLGAALAFADTVAVLPFWNAASNPKPNLDWIGESIAETVRDALGSHGVLSLERDDTWTRSTGWACASGWRFQKAPWSGSARSWMPNR